MMSPSSVSTHRAYRASAIERMDMVLGTLEGEDEADPSTFTSQYGCLGLYSPHHLCLLLLLMLCQISSKNDSRKTIFWFIAREHLVHSSGEDGAAGT